jgi:hypothetical protein
MAKKPMTKAADAKSDQQSIVDALKKAGMKPKGKGKK